MANDSNNSREAYRLIRTMQTVGKKVRTNHARIVVHTAQGPTSDSHSTSLAFMNYFVTLLQGTQMTMTQLVKSLREELFSRAQPQYVPVEVLPTLRQCLQLFKKSKNGQAPGENALTDEVYRAFYETLAPLYYPLCFKSHLYQSPPVFYRGGQIVNLYKGKGSFQEITNYRDVTLANNDSKSFGKLLRQHARSRLKDKAMPGMYGSGLNKGSTEIAHLHIIALLEHAKVKNITAAVLFVDIQTAFATMSREIALEDIEDDQQFVQRCVARGLHENVALMFVAYLNNQDTWNSPTEMHIHKMFKHMHKHTWSSMEYVQGILRTFSGCLAGTPLADLLYCFLMMWYFGVVHSELQQQGLIYHIPYQEETISSLQTNNLIYRLTRLAT